MADLPLYFQIMADLSLLSQWREEDAEFAKEQARRGREARERRKKKNLMRRMSRQCHSVKEEEDGDGDGAQRGGSDKPVEDEAPNNSAGLTKALKSLFRCTTCSSELPPPSSIYQARYQRVLLISSFDQRSYFLAILPVTGLLLLLD